MDNFDGYIADIYREMEAELIASMKRNLGLHEAEEALAGLKYPQWQAIKLKELRRFQRENERIMGKKLSGLPDEVSRQMIDELNQGSKHELKRYRKALKKGYKSAVVMKDSFFKVNDRKVQGLINALNNDLARANSAVLRMMNDQYRQTIFKAGMFVSNGVCTEEQAVKKAVEEFEKKGLNCIEYKDGRRVNIADYASMAVRTANQRAYMVGEGEFRKSIGETLVIISRHSTSCDLCKPFEGKVLIDDVYSGGTREDGDYMLLSQAMEQGLYHPRCRHGLGTYYPELEEINGYETEDDKLNDYGSKGTLLTNGSLTKAINNNRIYSGANYGAYTDLNDPDNSKRDRSAKEYYEQIRSRDRNNEIKAVANNTGFSEGDIERVFAHIFERKHLFADGTIKRFDPDYYMQQSWMRLREGKNIQEHDLTLLKHELAEEEIMGANLDVVYEYAHEKARKSYDYTKELLEYLKNHDA